MGVLGKQVKDSFDMVADIRDLINIPAVTSLLEGGLVEPEEKTTSPEVKGIVVNSIGILSSQVQVGNGNINIYAPPIESKVNGKPLLLADQQFLSNLSKVIQGLIDGVSSSEFKVEVTSLGKPLRDTDGSYFASIRYRYTSIQRGYKKL